MISHENNENIILDANCESKILLQLDCANITSKSQNQTFNSNTVSHMQEYQSLVRPSGSSKSEIVSHMLKSEYQGQNYLCKSASSSSIVLNHESNNCVNQSPGQDYVLSPSSNYMFTSNIGQLCDDSIRNCCVVSQCKPMYTSSKSGTLTINNNTGHSACDKGYPLASVVRYANELHPHSSVALSASEPHSHTYVDKAPMDESNLESQHSSTDSLQCQQYNNETLLPFNKNTSMEMNYDEINSKNGHSNNSFPLKHIKTTSKQTSMETNATKAYVNSDKTGASLIVSTDSPTDVYDQEKDQEKAVSQKLDVSFELSESSVIIEMDQTHESSKIKQLQQKIIDQVDDLRSHLANSYSLKGGGSKVNSVSAPINNVPQEKVSQQCKSKIDCHNEKDIKTDYGLDFEKIKNACVSKKGIDYIQTDYSLHAKYRKHFWPTCLVEDEDFLEWYMAYISVRDSGIPNCVGEQILLPSRLKITNWEKYLKAPKYAELLNFLRYGWPSGFIGPITVMDTSLYEDNHKSANDYPDQVDAYIENELKLGSLKGPFDQPPFEFFHLSSLMTVPKNSQGQGQGQGQRRIITDLKHPEIISVNNYIASNTILGITRPHKLPRSDDVVEYLDKNETSYQLFTADLKNSYKHFLCDPQDYPLYTIKWKNKYYFECTIPFGARNSSFSMQAASNAIIDILASKNIKSWMYLDDLLVISQGMEKAKIDQKAVFDLFSELGLEIVPEKCVGPTQCLKWIGIFFNVQNFTLSIPKEKLQELINQIDCIYDKRYITKKMMQSIIGRVMHISKCVVPSRIFSSRLLEALRAAKEGKIKITEQVRSDLLWFKEFSFIWNGKSCMNTQNTVRTIFTITVSGMLIATDLAAAYFVREPESLKIKQWQLEVCNLATAMNAFKNDVHILGQVRILCSDLKAVSAFNTGNTRDSIIDTIVRESWYSHALQNIDYRVDFCHELPSDLDKLKVCMEENWMQLPQLLEKMGMVPIEIDSEFLNKMVLSLAYRSGTTGPDVTGSCQAENIESSWHHSQYKLLCEGVSEF